MRVSQIQTPPTFQAHAAPVSSPAKSIPQAAISPQDQLQVSAPKGIPANLFAQELPPVEVVKRGNYTYSRNAFGVQITAVKFEDGMYFTTLSDRGLSIMLRQHDAKRDTLNFSDMNPTIPKTSQIPNIFFHIQGEGVSQMGFNKDHQVVISLTNGEHIVLSARDGETLISGPLRLSYNPPEGPFDVQYTGSDPVKRYTSKGDRVIW